MTHLTVDPQVATVIAVAHSQSVSLRDSVDIADNYRPVISCC